MLVVIGIFLLFALLFNGTVGTTFVNYSFALSGLMLIVSGPLRLHSKLIAFSKLACVIALISYLPMIWQRFQYDSRPNGFELGFDAFVLLMITVHIYVYSIKPESEQLELGNSAPKQG